MELLRKIKRLLGIGRTSEEDRSPVETSVTVEREREPEPDAETEAAVKGESEEVDAAPTEDSTAPTDDTGEGTPSAGTDASGSTETIRDEDGASERPETAAEPAEAAGPGTDDVWTDDADAAGETDDATPVSDEKWDEETETEATSAGTDVSGSTETIRDEDEASERPETAAEPAEAAGPGTDDVETDVDTADADATDGESGDESTVDTTPVDSLKGIGPAYADRLSEMGIETVADLRAADAAEVAERIDVSEKRVSRWIERARDHDDAE